MSLEKKRPAGLARRLAERSRSATTERTSSSLWRRETFTLPRIEARAKAREWFELYPKGAYIKESEFWGGVADGQIQFTIQSLPDAA